MKNNISITLCLLLIMVFAIHVSAAGNAAVSLDSKHKSAKSAYVKIEPNKMYSQVMSMRVEKKK